MGLPFETLGQKFFDALASGRSIAPLTESYPDMSVDDAYFVWLTCPTGACY